MPDKTEYLFCLLLLVAVTVFNRNIAATTNIRRATNRTRDEPVVPRFSPPFSVGLVNKSPNVAPKGLVNTNATQNKTTREALVK